MKKKCPYGPTSQAEADALREAKEKLFLDKRLAILEWGRNVLSKAKDGSLTRRTISFGALALASVAMVALPQGGANAWLHPGQAGGPPPPGPQWPAAGPGTNYWVADPSAGGSDSNAGTSSGSPWATIGHANTVLSGLTGTITLNFLSTFTYTVPGGGALLTPSGATFLAQGLIGATIPPLIQSASSGASGCVRLGPNSTLSGLAVTGDASSYGVTTVGTPAVLTHCIVTHFPVVVTPGSLGGIAVIGNDINFNINNNTIGGTSPTDITGNGIVMNIISGCSIKNNDIGNCGGGQLSTLQSGFGIHTQDTSIPGTIGATFTYSGGVPTNFLLEIANNIIHDCGGNITDSSGGGPSGIELGGLNLLWCHDNIVYGIQSVLGLVAGTDFDPIDCGDTAGTTLTERNICFNCQGGLIDFGDANSGPIICRYNLCVNCGTANNIFAGAIQGEGTNTIHQFYGNTYVCLRLNGNPAPRNIFIGAGLSSVPGSPPSFFANNLVYTCFPYVMFGTNGLSSTMLMTTNCWFNPVGVSNARYFDFGGGSTYPDQATAAAAQALFDQHGIATDPKFANAISAATWSGGVMTITTAIPHGQSVSFSVTIESNGFFNGSDFVHVGVIDGAYTATVTGASTFTFPLASDPTFGGTIPLASPGVWSVTGTGGIYGAIYNPNSFKINSSSSCYRTGINLVSTFGIDPGSTDFYGNPITSNYSRGCHQP